MRRLLVRRSRAGDGGVPYCTFCGKGTTRRRKVVRRADGLYICDECVDKVIDALTHEDIHRHLNA